MSSSLSNLFPAPPHAEGETRLPRRYQFGEVVTYHCHWSRGPFDGHLFPLSNHCHRHGQLSKSFLFFYFFPLQLFF